MLVAEQTYHWTPATPSKLNRLLGYHVRGMGNSNRYTINPKAGTPFTISGTTAGGSVVILYFGSASTGSSAFIGSSPGGSYSLAVTEPAGSYSVFDASGCMHFTVV